MSARKKPSYAKTVLSAVMKIESHPGFDPVVNDYLSNLRSWATGQLEVEKKAARAARLRAKADELEGK